MLSKQICDDFQAANVSNADSLLRMHERGITTAREIDHLMAYFTTADDDEAQAFDAAPDDWQAYLEAVYGITLDRNGSFTEGTSNQAVKLKVKDLDLVHRDHAGIEATSMFLTHCGWVPADKLKAGMWLWTVSSNWTKLSWVSEVYLDMGYLVSFQPASDYGDRRPTAIFFSRHYPLTFDVSWGAHPLVKRDVNYGWIVSYYCWCPCQHCNKKGLRFKIFLLKNDDEKREQCESGDFSCISDAILVGGNTNVVMTPSELRLLCGREGYDRKGQPSLLVNAPPPRFPGIIENLAISRDMDRIEALDVLTGLFVAVGDVLRYTTENSHTVHIPVFVTSLVEGNSRYNRALEAVMRDPVAAISPGIELCKITRVQKVYVYFARGGGPALAELEANLLQNVLTGYETVCPEMETGFVPVRVKIQGQYLASVVRAKFWLAGYGLVNWRVSGNQTAPGVYRNVGLVMERQEIDAHLEALLNKLGSGFYKLYDSSYTRLPRRIIHAGRVADVIQASGGPVIDQDRVERDLAAGPRVVGGNDGSLLRRRTLFELAFKREHLERSRGRVVSFQLEGKFSTEAVMIASDVGPLAAVLSGKNTACPCMKYAYYKDRARYHHALTLQSGLAQFERRSQPFLDWFKAQLLQNGADPDRVNLLQPLEPHQE